MTFFKTITQILAAGVSITAFSLLLYALTFNLRDRVARSFALILLCVVVVFTGEALGSATSDLQSVDFWLRLQWVGIVFLPAAYLQFTDGLLATTGKPSKGKRRWVVRLAYAVSLVFLLGLPFFFLVGPLASENLPAPYLRPTWMTILFLLYYLVSMAMAWYNLIRAYRRTTTPTSRRRMAYLMVGSLAPVLGTFPYMLFSSNFAARHQLIFWVTSSVSDTLTGGFIVVMAYAVAFFGVPWPDRVVKARLFKWIMRGPVTASVTLGLVTLVRRMGEAFGLNYSALALIVMVITILLMEYLITLFGPFWQRWLFYGSDRADLDFLRLVEQRLLTRNDLQQFLEMVVASVQDRLQADGAYVAAMDDGGLEMVVENGITSLKKDSDETRQLLRMVTEHDALQDIFQWGEDTLIPLLDRETTNGRMLLGLLGYSGVAPQDLDDEQRQSLRVLAERASLALRDRRIQKQVFQSLQELGPEVDLIQRMRAAGPYNDPAMLDAAELAGNPDLVQWVREALNHYWGGPKLTESPLMKLKVVQEEVAAHDGSQSNALRAILRQAIEKTRPEGERRFTGEWILYNILEMKFLEGRKVRDIASRLAMSEADLYRKQRIAIESVARAIGEMEAEALVEIREERQ